MFSVYLLVILLHLQPIFLILTGKYTNFSPNMIFFYMTKRLQKIEINEFSKNRLYLNFYRSAMSHTEVCKHHPSITDYFKNCHNISFK